MTEWLIARTEKRLPFSPLWSILCSCPSLSLSNSPSSSFSFFLSFSLHVVRLNFFSFSNSLTPLMLSNFSPHPQGQRCEEHGYGRGLHISHGNGCPSSWPRRLITSPFMSIEKNQMPTLICMEPISYPPVTRKRLCLNHLIMHTVIGNLFLPRINGLHISGRKWKTSALGIRWQH